MNILCSLTTRRRIFFEQPKGPAEFAEEYRKLTHEFIEKQFVPEISIKDEVACIFGHGVHFRDVHENSIGAPIELVVFTNSDSYSPDTLSALERFSKNHPGFNLNVENFACASTALTPLQEGPFYTPDIKKKDSPTDTTPAEITPQMEMRITVLPLNELYKLAHAAYQEYLKNEPNYKLEDADGRVLNKGATVVSLDTAAEERFQHALTPDLQNILMGNLSELTDTSAKPDVEEKVEVIRRAAVACLSK